MRPLISDPEGKEDLQGIQIQIKPIGISKVREHSMSMTIHGESTSSAYHRIHFLFEELSKTQESVQIRHYNKGRGETDEHKTTD